MPHDSCTSSQNINSGGGGGGANPHGGGGGGSSSSGSGGSGMGGGKTVAQTIAHLAVVKDFPGTLTAFFQGDDPPLE